MLLLEVAITLVISSLIFLVAFTMVSDITVGIVKHSRHLKSTLDMHLALDVLTRDIRQAHHARNSWSATSRGITFIKHTLDQDGAISISHIAVYHDNDSLTRRESATGRGGASSLLCCNLLSFSYHLICKKDAVRALEIQVASNDGELHRRVMPLQNGEVHLET